MTAVTGPSTEIFSAVTRSAVFGYESDPKQAGNMELGEIKGVYPSHETRIDTPSDAGTRESTNGKERDLEALVSAAAEIRLTSLIRTDEAIRWLHYALFQRPPGPACPRCGRKAFSTRFLDAWWAGKAVQCPSCHAPMSWRTGTPFRGSSLSPGQAVLLIAGIRAGVPRDTLAGWLGVCGRTVENWARRMGKARSTRPANPARQLDLLATSCPTPTGRKTKPLIPGGAEGLPHEVL